MGTATLTSYDEIPYDGKAFSKTHPDALATAARLCGMSPPDLEHCRILELGCANGGNLVPMAAELPGSRCVGIDLSPRQIETGQALAKDSGVENVELKAMSILEVDEAFGEFDYIICHGVFSWVPRFVQDKILQICRQNLASNGVAYISYNTYPGWHLRGLVREMFCYHTQPFQNPLERVAQARGFLEFLKKAWEFRDPDGTFGRVLKDEFEELEWAHDSYIFHEHLEEVNDPLYFHQFAERAGAADLQYLWELDASVLAGSLPEAEMHVLDQLSNDLIRREQYFDFIRNRTFRRTLLCHANVPVCRQPVASAVREMHVTARVNPVSEKPDLHSIQPETFRSPKVNADAELSVTTNRPIAKRLFVELSCAAPASIPVQELACRVVAWRSELPAELAENEPMADLDSLSKQLLQLHLSGLVQLHVHVPRFVTTISKRPVAHPLSRQMAARGPRVTNRRHLDVLLEDLHRFLLHHLDGEHTFEDLQKLVMQSVMENAGSEEPPSSLHSEEGQRQVDESIRAALSGLAQQALLVE